MSRTLQRVACTKCRQKCDPWRSFCGNCGGSLVGTCGVCRAVNHASDKFCGGCARSLAAAPKAVAKVSAPPRPIPKAAAHTIQISILDEAIVSERGAVSD